MISISELTENDHGRWVVYRSGPHDAAKIERGRIKSWNDTGIFVVYNCAEDWDNYTDYTAAHTKPEDLEWSVLRDIDEDTIKLIRENGKDYVSGRLPRDIQRGAVGTCFDWSAYQTARLHPKYRYVEGIALSPDDGHPILHAWLTDGVFAYDPTWAADLDGVPQAVPTIYFGIEIPILKVREFMAKTGYQSVIGNRHMAPEIIQGVIDGRR